MFENEEVRTEVVIDGVEEVNFMVVPEKDYDEFDNGPGKELNGVLIGAAVAATGIVAYKFAPKVIDKVKKMWNKEKHETLEEKQSRLLEELAEVNSQLTSEDDDE